VREKSHAATGVHGVRKSQGGFKTGYNVLRGIAASFDQLPVLLLIERRQMNGDFRAGWLV